MNRIDAAIHDASMEVAEKLWQLMDRVTYTATHHGQSSDWYQARLELGWALRDYASAIRNGRPFPRASKEKAPR